MNYMDKVEAWFNAELARYLTDGDTEAFKKAVKDKILESYRNGQRSRRSKKENEPTSETK